MTATKTDKETIVEFLKKMSTQDNRCTAFPFYYVINTAKWTITDEDYASGDYRIRYVNEENHEDVIDEEEWESRPECESDLTEEQKDDGISAQDAYKRFCEVKTWQEEGLFFTETDAQRHLELNHYHYSPDAHTYVKHVWRAPELEEFLLAIFRHFGVEPREDKGTM